MPDPHGYPSSGRPAADLDLPPSGPAPGSNPWVQDAAESIEAAGIFAVLRDIADAEPLHRQDGTEGPTNDGSVWVRCSMCDVRHLGARGPGRGAYPFPHLISCPWVRVTHVVGVKADG